MKNLLYLLLFFLITPITLATTIFALHTTVKFSAKQESIPLAVTSPSFPQYGSRVYAAIPDTTGKVAGVATVSDARVEIIRQYLERYSSPMLGQEGNLVYIADKYGLDFRLLPAIAQQESNLCKIIPHESYNCWGWGIHSKGTLRFQSYVEAMEAVAKGLREEYIDKGYTTPELIMKKYTPLSPGTWAMGVSQFMAEME